MGRSQGEVVLTRVAAASRWLWFALALCCISAAPSSPPRRVKVPKVAHSPYKPLAESPGPEHFKGRFLGFASTDYQLVAFCVKGDSTQWYGVSDPAAAFFVAAHAGTELDITVQAVETDTLETGEAFTSYGLSRASLNGYDSEEWWNNVLATLGYERAYKYFNALSDSLDVGENRLPHCDRSHDRAGDFGGRSRRMSPPGDTG